MSTASLPLTGRKYGFEMGGAYSSWKLTNETESRVYCYAKNKAELDMFISGMIECASDNTENA